MVHGKLRINCHNAGLAKNSELLTPLNGVLGLILLNHQRKSI